MERAIRLGLMGKNKKPLLELLTWTPELVEHFWSLVAQSPLAKLSFSKLVCAELVEFIRREMPPPAKVLDFGAGDGDLADALLVAGYEVGVYEPSTIRSQNLLAKPLAKHPRFLGFYPKSSDEVFDVVLAFEVLEHLLPETVDADMALVARFLHPKGKLIGTVPLDESLENNGCICPVCSHYFHRWQHVRSFSSHSLASFLAAYGIGDIQSCVAADFAVSLVFVAGKEPRNHARELSLALPAPSLDAEALSLRSHLKTSRQEQAQLKEIYAQLKEDHATLFSAVGHLSLKQQKAIARHLFLTHLFSRMLQLMDEPSLASRIPKVVTHRTLTFLRSIRDWLLEVHQRFLFFYNGISWQWASRLNDEARSDLTLDFAPAHEFSQNFKNGRPSVCLFKNGLSWGGAERQLVLTAKELKKKGCDVRVVLLHSKVDDRHYFPLLQEAAIPISLLPGPGVVGKGLRKLKKASVDISKLTHTPVHLRAAIIGLAAELTCQPADVLHCYLDSNNIIGGWAGLLSRTPMVRMSGRNVNPSHFPWFYPGDYKVFYDPLLKFPQIKLENNSYHGARDYADWLGIPESKIEVIHNGIDLEMWPYCDRGRREITRSRLGLGPEEFVVLSVFRFSNEKRPFDLVRVAFEMKSKGLSVKFVHVGHRGELKDPVLSLALELGVRDRFIFLDVQDSISGLMAAADIILLVSEHEGFPNAIMEGMASGLPVVGTNAGGMVELVPNKENGFLHVPGKVQEMAESLSILYQDSALRVQMGGANRKRIEECFSVKRMGNKLIDFYLSASNRESRLNV